MTFGFWVIDVADFWAGCCCAAEFELKLRLLLTLALKPEAVDVAPPWAADFELLLVYAALSWFDMVFSGDDDPWKISFFL